MTTNEEVTHLSERLAEFSVERSMGGAIAPMYFREEAEKFIMLTDALAAARAKPTIRPFTNAEYDAGRTAGDNLP